jgi:peptidoglycan/xylan/chitin deacetylase (PgdA/CDA1 family)
MSNADKLEVFLTCDTEIWCEGWDGIDEKFPDAFARYVYGRDSRGEAYGLPRQLKLLQQHGLHAVFFVESLFTGRFGIGPLQEIVGLVRDAGQEVQLHLHPEWADESRLRWLPHVPEKRQHLRYFDAGDQATLVEAGIRALQAAGAPRPTAFRAGSYALNADTFKALARVGIRIDSSYNATMLGDTSGLAPGHRLADAARFDGLLEFPVSYFRDGLGQWRHAQLGACAFEELRDALWSARHRGLRSFVIVFHNFELLNQAKSGRDPTVVKRFERLCGFLADHSNDFCCRGFADMAVERYVVRDAPDDPLLTASLGSTLRRHWEQAARRLAG